MSELLNRASIEYLKEPDLDAVVAIHRAAFPDSMLSALGISIIRRYYESLLSGPHDLIALVIGPRDQRVGFIFAGVFRGALRAFVKRNYIPLAGNLLVRPWLLARSKNRRRVSAGVRALIPFLVCKPKNPAVLGASSRFGIQVIAVDPKYRRCGYGRLLMSEIEDIAAARGFAEIFLTVDSGNQPNIDFYESLGWSKRVVDGQWRGVLQKQLADGSDRCSDDGKILATDSPSTSQLSKAANA